MINPNQVPRLKAYNHNVYQYSSGPVRYKTKLDQGVNMLCLPTSSIYIDDKNQLKEISSNSRVNIFNTVGFHNNLEAYRIFQSIQSHSLYFNFWDLLLTKQEYFQFKKRMQQSPCLLFLITSYNFESKALRKRAKSIIKSINKINYNKIFIEGLIKKTTDVRKFKTFFQSINFHELKLTFPESLSRFKKLKMFYHPSIIFNLQQIEINLDIALFVDDSLLSFPLRHFHGILILNITHSMSSTKVNISKFLILLAFRNEKAEIKNWNKHVRLTQKNFSNKTLVKLFFSKRNLSGKFEKTWFGILDGKVESQQELRFYLKQLESETGFYFMSYSVF